MAAFLMFSIEVRKEQTEINKMNGKGREEAFSFPLAPCFINPENPVNPVRCFPLPASSIKIKRFG